MIETSLFKKKRIHVFGLGISGCAVAEFLIQNAADVSVGDDNENKKSLARDKGLRWMGVAQCDFSQIDILVLSPGIALHFPSPHQIVIKARENNVPIVCDIALFLQVLKAAQKNSKVIGITGTNGKSTTTALLTHCLHQAGHKAVMLGNIGFPVFALDTLEEGIIYVIEMSSYQIDLLDADSQFDIVALLNITVDHIDRHGSFEQYRDTKYALLLKHLQKNGYGVIGVDTKPCYDFYHRLLTDEYDVYAVSYDAQSDIHNGVIVKEGDLVIRSSDNKEQPIVRLDKLPTLRGRHNWQNAACVVQICKKMGICNDIIVSALHSFLGLPHRMEKVCTHNHVTFVNDSKATNSESTQYALASYPVIFWIAGGIAKQGGIENLHSYFNHIVKAYLIGEAADDFSDTCKEYQLSHAITRDMETAVKQAYQDACHWIEQHTHTSDTNILPEMPVVLLSPACASFDQYANFVQRGESFKEYVMRLTG